MIDHSLLHPTLTDAEIREGCELSCRYGVAAVCVKPYTVSLAAQLVAGAGVAVCAVASFPHGNSALNIKLAEADHSMQEGATEIDVVVNVGRVLSGHWEYVSKEVHSLNQLVISRGAILKVIFENDYLGDAQIIRLCQICSEAAVGFVKTSTGYGFVKQADGSYGYKGATVPHLKLMRQHTAPGVEIKAAGGVRTLDDLLMVRSLGVTRIGATATAAILDEARQRQEAGALELKT